MKKFLSFALCAALLCNNYVPVKAIERETVTQIQKTDILNNLINKSINACITIGATAVCTYILYKTVEYCYKKNQSAQFTILPAGSIQDSFNTVAGNENAKEALNDIVSYLQNPRPFYLMGARIPKGVLLEGAPGTGKTLMARALAGQAQCAFISVSGSEFVDKYVGTGAARVRELFDTARKLNAPCIIFIDEIDTLIQKRTHDPMGGAQEYNQTINEFLKQLDGFDKHPYPIIIVGATNRADMADPAAIRPGRFDRIVKVELPTLHDRESILAIHANKVCCKPDLNLKIIAQKTTGFSGADLANLINEAAIRAIHKQKDGVDQSDLETALDTIVMGHPNKSLRISPEEKRMIAYHEAGHALVHILLNGKDGLHKVSIISRGVTGGHTAFLSSEQLLLTKPGFIHAIMVSFGGKAAEQIIYNTVTTGPSGDIAMATALARAMICHYGMSEKLGPIAYTYNPDRSLSAHAPATLAAIDQEVKEILETSYQKVMRLLTEHKNKLDIIAQTLLEKEELSAEEIYTLIGMQ